MPVRLLTFPDNCCDLWILIKGYWSKRLSRADDQDELFRYTASKWMLNEEHYLKQRYVKFNVDSSCRQAASLFGNDTKCVHIAKQEGNFNKAYALTMDDGNEVIAKIPSPITTGGPLQNHQANYGNGEGSCTLQVSGLWESLSA